MHKSSSVQTTMQIPTDYKLGDTNIEISLSSVEENRNAVVSLAYQARHTINIFTQDLDAALYNNKAFEKHIFKLATRHRSAKIHILVQDSTRAIQNSHRLIVLAQKLTSSVFIKNPATKFRNIQSAFMTVDGVGMLYRNQGNSHNYKAALNFMSPQRASELDEFFSEVWELSDIDIQVRRLTI